MNMKICMRTDCVMHGSVNGAKEEVKNMFASQSSLVYLIKPLAMRSMAGLCHLLCGTL